MAQKKIKAENLPNFDLHPFHFGFLLSYCLLYTSDAADERSSVDLGGRRIIKKKKALAHRCSTRSQ